MLLLAIPGVLYAGYYSKLLGEPIWFYELRTLTGSELLAALTGFAAGWAQVRLIPKVRLSRLGARMLVPVLLGVGLAVPYLKPIFRPLRNVSLRDEWQDGVCLQSSASTCGPASAVTILRELGQPASEAGLAQESFASASGTENWYLARALRHHGMRTRFLFSAGLQCSLPAISGVRLRSAGNAGHFIALLGREGEQFVVADPLDGRFTNTLGELRMKYEFTGFLMVVNRDGRRGVQNFSH
ncbi:MAG: peptidase bacteriocin processing [Pedosphaera sp.]|nr:peptidase bacteriocin processing [Pedosphaera sp.]